MLAFFVAVAIWATLRGSLDPQAPAIAPGAKVPALTARPEDIEAHGKAAQTTLAPDDARARNLAVPFDPRLREVARPFLFQGSDADRARARECLAAAVLYEAGDDTVGQAAVAQVVLNRVRHPAFPGTVCGVVYQGSQRSTGCQFTFTCDGSLRRRQSDAAWNRAREVAGRALAGWVDDSVGLATHYHTNWVYPYWSPSLRKLAQVGTHLFFGWPGSWGGPTAFRRAYRGNEAAVGTALAVVAAGADLTGDTAAIDPGAPKILGLPQPKAELPAGRGNVPLYGSKLRLVGSDGRSFGLWAPVGVSSAQMVNAALALCGEPGPCRVAAWSSEDDVPGSFPFSEGSRSLMVFEYVRGEGGAARPKFDCSRFPNKDPKACLRAAPDVPEVLSGVRFKAG